MTLNYLEEKYNLKDGLLLAEAVTKDYAKSFHFASKYLPKTRRQDTFNIYAFCRLTDNLADDTDHWPLDQRLKLILDWEEKVKECFLHKNSDNLILKVAFDTAKKYQIPERHFLELIEGVKSDLTKTRFKSFKELDHYCYLVGAIPGLMVTYVLGFTDIRALDHAISMGKAMQITNILRDLKEDMNRNRLYLASEDMQEFGYSEQDLKNGLVNTNFKNLMKMYITKANEMYEFSYFGLQYLSKEGRFCAKLCGLVYSEILNKIELQHYDVFTKRANTSFFNKLTLVLKAFFNSKS